MDFGTEPSEIVKLFKSDFGREPEIWEILEKGTLSETIAAKQGTSQVAAPVKPTTTTPTPTTPNVGGLSNRLRTAQETQQHPAVQQATDRLNKQGIQVIDKMPSHYTPDMRAKAMNNVAKGVEFMHQQFPGMQRLHQRFGMKYKLQGPQMLGTGQLMGQYHPPESSQNPGVYPQIELNGTAEHTLWHEHAHFLDHASTGNLFGRGRGTNTPGHALHDFAKELQNHPVRQMAQKHEIAAAVQSGQQNLINHAMYRNQEDEVFARWFNSHMNYLHGKAGEDPTSEPYDAQYNEGWTPEHHEYFGGKLRDILKQHKMTRSFGEYLDSLHKALEETRQGRPLPGTQRATRMPQGYKVPRKINRPGVRGSTLWWIDPKGNVRYGPRPVQRQPKQEEPERVRNYLESERPWSFVSAHSDDRPQEENDSLHVQLGKELQTGGYQVYSSKGYYNDVSGQLREEPSYLVFGLTTKSAIPLGKKYGQQTVLTHHGLFDLNNRTLAPIRYKRVETRDLPKDVPQSVIMTQPNHVTLVVNTGQPVPFGGSTI